jgi:hypothetical protein
MRRRTAARPRPAAPSAGCPRARAPPMDKCTSPIPPPLTHPTPLPTPHHSQLLRRRGAYRSTPASSSAVSWRPAGPGASAKSATGSATCFMPLLAPGAGRDIAAVTAASPPSNVAEGGLSICVSADHRKLGAHASAPPCSAPAQPPNKPARGEQREACTSVQTAWRSEAKHGFPSAGAPPFHLPTALRVCV